MEIVNVRSTRPAAPGDRAAISPLARVTVSTTMSSTKANPPPRRPAAARSAPAMWPMSRATAEQTNTQPRTTKVLPWQPEAPCHTHEVDENGHDSAMQVRMVKTSIVRAPETAVFVTCGAGGKVCDASTEHEDRSGLKKRCVVTGALVPPVWNLLPSSFLTPASIRPVLPHLNTILPQVRFTLSATPRRSHPPVTAIRVGPSSDCAAGVSSGNLVGNRNMETSASAKDLSLSAMVSFTSNADVRAHKFVGAATSATPACLWKPCRPPYSTTSNGRASEAEALLVVEYTVSRIVILHDSVPPGARCDRAADVFDSVTGNTAFQAKTSAPRLGPVRRTAMWITLVMMPYRRPGSGPRTPDTRGARQGGSAVMACGAGAATAAGCGGARRVARVGSEARGRIGAVVVGGAACGDCNAGDDKDERGTNAGDRCRANTHNGALASLTASVNEWISTRARRGDAPPPTPPVVAD